MQLQQEHEVLDRPLLAIDMRLPDRLVFRPRPASATSGDGVDSLAIPPIPPAMAPPPPVSVLAKKPT